MKNFAMKTMKLKIRFAEEIRFDVPTRQNIRSWTQLLSGTQDSFHSLAIAEIQKPCKHGHD
jgi:hypothetical protein